MPRPPAPRRSLLAACAVVALVLLGRASPASADRVALKTGETILGKVVVERTNEGILVVEDYVSGGLREIAWDAIVEQSAADIRAKLGWPDGGEVLVKAEAITFRLNTGVGELRGVVEKTEGGFLYVRNVSSKEPHRLALADIVSREPIEMEPQEIRPVAEVFEDMRTQIAPDDARKWFALGQYGERIGAYELAKEAFETAAADEGYLQRETARTAAQRMTALIADKASYDELRELRVALSAGLWKRVREAAESFPARHPEAGEAIKKKLEELKADFTKRRAAYFAAQAGPLFERVFRRLLDPRVRPKDAKFNDVQSWMKKDAAEETLTEMQRQLAARDPALTVEEVKTFFEARPKRANGWRRATYDSGSFLVEPAKIKPPSPKPKPPAGSKKGNEGPPVTIPIPPPPTLATWWPAASTDVRARFFWASFVEKGGFYEVQPKRERTPCPKCEGTGVHTSLLSGGSTLTYLCERCGGSQYDQIVIYR